MVALLEEVWDAIRGNHPELPSIVIVTGSGWIGSPRWGHFRAAGWAGKGEFIPERNEHAGPTIRLGEMFIAGETLAKGAAHTLETMLHEAAHVLARVREVTDTSRQGRWHNAKFRQLAEELGLVWHGDVVSKQHGFSEMMLAQATKDRYAELTTQLDAEIRLVINLPGWVAGQGGSGGELVQGGRRPSEGTGTGSQIKATCECDEPRIIRVSRKVLDGPMISCSDCGGPFQDRN